MLRKIVFSLALLVGFMAADKSFALSQSHAISHDSSHARSYSQTPIAHADASTAVQKIGHRTRHRHRHLIFKHRNCRYHCHRFICHHKCH